MRKASIKDSLEYFISKENARNDLKYVKGDKSTEIHLDATPTIAYDYLFLEESNEYSFSNEEFTKNSSEEFPNKSDYAIYFEKIKSICSNTIDKTLNQRHTHFVNPNRRLHIILKNIFEVDLIDEIQNSILQFPLYTNKTEKGKSPRIFCFIGKYAIIYVLFYDPYHKICSSE
jgi:hypothetical protein